jgi:hypothetical protein
VRKKGNASDLTRIKVLMLSAKHAKSTFAYHSGEYVSNFHFNIIADFASNTYLVIKKENMFPWLASA